jgi:hypothetical protein
MPGATWRRLPGVACAGPVPPERPEREQPGALAGAGPAERPAREHGDEHSGKTEERRHEEPAADASP